MKRTTGILVLAALLGTLWSCGGDSSSGSDTGGDQTAPPSPSPLRVDKIRDGEVWLSWAEVVDEESEEVGYKVYRAEDGETAVVVDSTFRTIFQDQGLHYEAEYTYYVTAVDAAGNESGPIRSAASRSTTWHRWHRPGCAPLPTIWPFSLRERSTFPWTGTPTSKQTWSDIGYIARRRKVSPSVKIRCWPKWRFPASWTKR